MIVLSEIMNLLMIKHTYEPAPGHPHHQIVTHAIKKRSNKEGNQKKKEISLLFSHSLSYSFTGKPFNNLCTYTIYYIFITWIYAGNQILIIT